MSKILLCLLFLFLMKDVSFQKYYCPEFALNKRCTVESTATKPKTESEVKNRVGLRMSDGITIQYDILKETSESVYKFKNMLFGKLLHHPYNLLKSYSSFGYRYAIFDLVYYQSSTTDRKR